MGPALEHRQRVRRSVDLRVQLTICEDSLAQVSPVAGRSLPARLTDVSAGGAGVVAPTYLPRAGYVMVEIPTTGNIPAGTARARVMSVDMLDREPHYHLGLRFEDHDNGLIRRLETWRNEGLPGPDTAGQSQPGAAAEDLEGVSGWIAILQRDGLVSPDVLQTALRESEQDPERAGEWLLSNGCLRQRELALAQAESHGLPFLEVGDYRVNHDNRRLIPEEMARTYGIFPVFKLEQIITLAVVRPLDLTVLDQIRLHTGCEVDPCLTHPRELNQLIDWAYGGFQATEADTSTASELVWAEILKDVADAPAVKLVNVLLDRAAASTASDIHLDPDETTLHVRFRIDGVLREVPAPPKSLLPAIVSRIKILARMDIAETRRPQDGHFKLAVGHDELDIRVSTLPSTDGEVVVLRLLRSGTRLLSFDELGMDTPCLEDVDRLIHLPHGMLLVTGPTGSGKTTTLYSALTRLDRVRQNIITLEDPVEIRLPRIRQVGVNPKAGLTFQRGLRAILRQDPDCIMLGEIRDGETAEIALQAALTGHLVLATLHTNSAAGAASRLLDMGAPDFLVCSALVGVLAQRLCRRLCRHCARQAERLPTELEAVIGDARDGGTYLRAVGCKRCGHTGYDGRVGCFELLVITDELRRAFLSREDERAITAMARASGTRLLVEDGLEKVRQGLTTAEELLRVAGRLDALSELGQRQPTGTTAGGSPPARGADPADGSGAGFDVRGYQELLSRWLAPLGHARAGPEDKPAAAAVTGSA